MNQKAGNQSSLIENLRDGVDVVRLILFKRLKEHLKKEYPQKNEKNRKLLAAAIVNELFGTKNLEKNFCIFAKNNIKLIEKELSKIPKNFPDLLIPLTDALRMHFLCNYAEGLPDYSAKVLARAKDLGILIEEREVPLPRGFMNLVYKIGTYYGIIKNQKASAKDETSKGI